MIFRYLFYVIIVIAFIIFGFMLVKDLGQTRKNIEKKLRAETDAKLDIDRSVWQQGPKKKRK